jgi:hypothetical protein
MGIAEQVAIFLWVVGHNTSNRQTMERFQHSGDTISTIFHLVLKALMCLAPDFVYLPHSNSWPPEVRENSKFFPYFKDCIGALDGSHIPALVPANLVTAYRNRKGFTSQNILAVCNFDMTFSYILSGWEGSAHDGRVLKDALSKDLFIPEGRFYLGDAGYGLSYQVLTPYRRVRYHLREQGSTCVKGGQRTDCQKFNFIFYFFIFY